MVVVSGQWVNGRSETPRWAKKAPSFWLEMATGTRPLGTEMATDLPIPVAVTIKYTRKETHTRYRVQIMSQIHTRTGGGYPRAARARQSIKYSAT
jgi:hypothetical protein